ncbi:GL17810 [Drosophila persimilis]|uniref:GL17810 n=1 Tax=Drosophila persimilis TaxID=7234 RepID=B4IS99_DROPE|nr:GL17810 [Drosophila persimilis]
MGTPLDGFLEIQYSQQKYMGDDVGRGGRIRERNRGHAGEDWRSECGPGIMEDARQTLEAVAGSWVSTDTLVPLMLADPKVGKI